MTEKLGVVAQPGCLDVMREVEKDIGKRRVGKLMDLPKGAMEITETRLRLPLFIDRLINGDAPEDAAKAVFQFHFDYAPEGLAKFEQNVMKRLMPFYRWTRGNIPLQLEQMAKQPGKYAAIGKLVDNLQVDKEKAKEEFLNKHWQASWVNCHRSSSIRLKRPPDKTSSWASQSKKTAESINSSIQSPDCETGWKYQSTRTKTES